MRKNILDILSKSNKNRGDQLLMEYLSDELSHEEKHSLEEEMNEDDMLRDAAEGLEQFADPASIPGYIRQINAKLDVQLKGKEKNKRGRTTFGLSSTYITIAVVLIIVLLAFVLLYLELRR